MLTRGTAAPDFELPDVTSGELVSLSDFEAKRALLVMFICRHCPYVAHVREELGRLGRDFADSELGVVAISANDPDAYPEDAPEGLAQDSREAGYVFPYLFDAVRLLEPGGIDPESIDTCMKLGAGHPMGPLALLDFVGLDVAAAIGESIGADVPERVHELIAAGRLGRKAGAGFYDYSER